LSEQNLTFANNSNGINTVENLAKKVDHSRYLSTNVDVVVQKPGPKRELVWNNIISQDEEIPQQLTSQKKASPTHQPYRPALKKKSKHSKSTSVVVLRKKARVKPAAKTRSQRSPSSSSPVQNVSCSSETRPNKPQRDKKIKTVLQETAKKAVAMRF